MEYHVSLLHETTHDQWAAKEALYITVDEYLILKKVIEIIKEQRRGIQTPQAESQSS